MQISLLSTWVAVANSFSWSSIYQTLWGGPQTSVEDLIACQVRPGRKYCSSITELAWFNGSKVGLICKTATSAAQIDGTRHSLSYSHRVWHPRKHAAGTPTAREAASLSWIKQGGNFEPIEPLSGIARHPWAEVGCHNLKTSLFNIQYLVLANHCSRGSAKDQKRGRNLFFDLGCSVYDDGSPLDLDAGSGIGPSLPIFSKLYSERCIDFDAIYAFEASPMNPTEWWRHVPVEMRKVLHFFNVPVEEDSLQNVLAGRQNKSNYNSFLQLLQKSAKPEDFVVIKLDIEGQVGSPELQIAQAIATRPHLARLVDEIYFEYHFYMDGLSFGWGRDWAKLKALGNVDDALGLMRKLRQQGIRAHFWI